MGIRTENETPSFKNFYLIIAERNTFGMSHKHKYSLLLGFTFVFFLSRIQPLIQVMVI